MTETEWFASIDPQPMVALLNGKFSERKRRLFACACLRRVWVQLNELSQKVVELSEYLADGRANQIQLNLALDKVRKYREVIPSHEEPSYLHYLGEVANVGYWRFRRPLEESTAELVFLLWPSLQENEVADRTAELAAGLARVDTWEANEDEPLDSPIREAKADDAYQSTLTSEKQKQAALLRDLFNNPFHSMTIDESCLTSQVNKVAQTIYSDQAFHLLPELTDMLTQAGCKNAEILNHCRQPGEHVRGCWVVDLLLNKK